MTSNDRTPVVGVILAGGLSRRMGGGDKALLPLAGATMLERVLARLAPQVDSVVINANGNADRFDAFGLPVVADPVPGFPGPLAGVLAGMRWAASRTPPATDVLTVSADAPFLPLDLHRKLAAGRVRGRAPIALARSGGRLHPVIGLWPVSLAPRLAASLAAGSRKVEAWADEQGAAPVDFPLTVSPEGPIDPFFNANTPAEWEAAERVARWIAP
jgi:molybdopterin-guanine dinucleotide biosynthesis protein A